MTMAKAHQSSPLSVRSYGPTSERPSRTPSGVIPLRGEPVDAPGYRIYGDADGGVELRFGDFGISVEVIAFNPVAITFRPVGEVALPLHEPVEARIDWKGEPIGPIRGRIEPIGQQPGEFRFRIAMRDISFSVALQMMEMLRELLDRGAAALPTEAPQVHEEFRDPERMQKIINALSILTGEGTLRGAGIMAHLRLEGLADDGSVIWLHDETLKDWGDGPWAIEVVGYNSLYNIYFETAKTEAGRTITAPPRLVTRTRHRFFRRATMTSPRKVRYLHPRWNDDGVSEGVIKDVSYGGMSFEFDSDKSVLFPGLRIPMFTVEGQDGEPIRLTGVIRSVTSSPTAGKMLCGVAVSPWCAEDEPHWIRVVATQLHPRTDTSENLLEELWNLFDTSGYFNLAGRSAEDFAALKRKFFTVGRRAADAPHLICQAVWPSPKGIEGSVSFLKAYDTAWMGHQLAKRHGRNASPGVEPAQVLRDVYCHSFEHPQTDPDLRWIVGFVEGEVRWVQGSHLEFVRRRESTGEVLGVPVHMMSAKCNEESKVSGDGVIIEPATPLEKQLLARRIARTRPACYVDAYDYVPERIGLERVTDLWRASGMERERAIFFARSKDRPVAALVVESGEEGTNLFRLLDCCRVFPIASQVDPAVYALLIDEARRWFKARGRTEFLFFREDMDDSYVEPARLAEISMPYMWIVSARLVPDFLEHVSEVAGGRPKVRSQGRT